MRLFEKAIEPETTHGSVSWILYPEPEQVPLPSPIEDMIRLRQKCSVSPLGDGSILVHGPPKIVDAEFRARLLKYVSAIWRQLNDQQNRNTDK